VADTRSQHLQNTRLQGYDFASLLGDNTVVFLRTTVNSGGMARMWSVILKYLPLAADI
jgi:hypothetical protein